MDCEYILEQITCANIADINKPNQEFTVFGRIVPIFDGKSWSFTEVLLHKPYEFRFPDDDIDYAEYINNPNKNIFFIYVDNICAGQIRIRSNWNSFCYVEDIAVESKMRNKGLAKLLFDAAEHWDRGYGLKGFMLEAQDFNLGACRMYYKYGFIIGSVDNMLYYNTKNKGDLALYWYKVF